MKEDHRIEEIFKRLSFKNPNPAIELGYTTPYTLMVAVILSAQSTDVGVNKATPRLFKVADTPDKIVELGEEKLKQYIKTIGLYNTKAKNIIAMSKLLIEKFNGEVPDNFDDLQTLPGVGRKSANVILSCLFDQTAIAVDTHVFRVSNRLGLCSTSTPIATEKTLMKVIPEKWKKKAHHWLVLHGRYICKAVKPKCEACLLSDLCTYDKKRTTAK